LQQDVWTYRVAREATRLSEPWGGATGGGGTWFVPRSFAHLSRADLVLRVDAGGRPVAIEVNVGPDEPAAFLHRIYAPPRTSPPPLKDATSSPELERRLYGSVGKRQGDWTLITTPE
jgi:hypothetical protein